MILLSLVKGQPVKTLYGDGMVWILSGIIACQSVKQILGGFFIAIYRIICMKRPEIAMSLYRQREITNQLFFLELLSLIFFLEFFYLGASMTGTEPVMEFLRGHSMTMDHILKQASGSSEWEIKGMS